jgi:fluoride exporter
MGMNLRWQYLALVFAGGTVGTAARYFLSLVVPDWEGIQLGIFLINVAGAFALGLLLEVLALRGADRGSRRVARLLIGTGVLGGFTTYSAFAVGADGLIVGDQVVAGLAYSVATILVGALATFAGIAAGAAISRRRPDAGGSLDAQGSGTR